MLNVAAVGHAEVRVVVSRIDHHRLRHSPGRQVKQKRRHRQGDVRGGGTDKRQRHRHRRSWPGTQDNLVSCASTLLCKEWQSAKLNAWDIHINQGHCDAGARQKGGHCRGR